MSKNHRRGFDCMRTHREFTQPGFKFEVQRRPCWCGLQLVANTPPNKGMQTDFE
jgi:hypothetical protein